MKGVYTNPRAVARRNVAFAQPHRCIGEKERSQRNNFALSGYIRIKNVWLDFA
jgi:hypothetical protein